MTRSRICCIVVLALMITGVQTAKGSPAPALPLALDGVGASTHTYCDFTNQVCTESQLLTTAKGHDVILLALETFGNANVSITDSSGLRFAERLSYFSVAYSQRLWEFYARATSPLTSDNITVVVDHCCYTFPGIQALAVHGANTIGVFDPNPSIPATASCPGSGCGPGNCSADFLNPGACSATIQTSNIDLVLAMTPINDAGPCGGEQGRVPKGFTTIASQNNRFEVCYTITSAPGTTVVFDCNGTDAMAIVLDAISFYGAFGI